MTPNSSRPVCLIMMISFSLSNKRVLFGPESTFLGAVVCLWSLFLMNLRAAAFDFVQLFSHCGQEQQLLSSWYAGNPSLLMFDISGFLLLLIAWWDICLYYGSFSKADSFIDAAFGNWNKLFPAFIFNNSLLFFSFSFILSLFFLLFEE